MMLVKWNATLCTNFLIAFVTICLLPPTARGAGQSTPASGSPDTQLLQALVSELRQIRLAMEHANAVSVRMQATLQRMQTEQSQVNRLSGELDSVHREVMRAETEQAQESAHLSQPGQSA
jgi:tRNA C32,U32 (ribose-2'-O)-methylase TrmJ